MTRNSTPILSTLENSPLWKSTRKSHDKELLVIVDYFKVWRRYLEGSLYMVQVFTDHKNLEYFMTTKVLNQRQACWAQELAGMDFKIFYRK
jgi:hypothetical protein